MATEVTSYTVPASTGNTTFNLNNGSLTPSLIEIEAGPRAGTNETDMRRSSGWTDGTRQRVISTYADGTLRGTRESNAYCIMHYTNVAGTLTKQFSASIVSMSAGSFVLNFDVVNTSYQIYVKVFS